MWAAGQYAFFTKNIVTCWCLWTPAGWRDIQPLTWKRHIQVLLVGDQDAENVSHCAKLQIKLKLFEGHYLDLQLYSCSARKCSKCQATVLLLTNRTTSQLYLLSCCCSLTGWHLNEWILGTRHRTEGWVSKVSHAVVWERSNLPSVTLRVKE